MRIVHLALQAPYNEGWGYQENLLTKYQVKLGYDVTLIVSCNMNSANSEIVTCEPEDYISPDGFRVVRVEAKKIISKKISSFLKISSVYNLLKEINPDLIMVHGLGNFSVLQVRKYVKKINPECKVIADNHLDYNNCSLFNKKNIKSFILKKNWMFLNSVMKKHYRKVYGVSPKRVEVAAKFFGIPADKLDLLPAGADDEKIDFENQESIRTRIRNEFEIGENDFLIVTGGKIDEKKNIDRVMEAVAQIDRENVKLIVFGDATDTMQLKIESLAKHNSIRYVGWVSAKETYDFFSAADLVFFPGLHSVMWEQACATKTPCVFRKLDGFEHLDVGGNCDFLEDVSVSGIEQKISELVFTERYYKIKDIAKSDKTEFFLYSQIAKKTLECLEE